MERVFARHRFPKVVHLAAQAGVIPHVYADANLEGFVNVLEGCRHHGCGPLSMPRRRRSTCQHQVAVFGKTDHPVSLYAATKKANELMAHSYSHLYRLPVTGLRFFTSYGPWGRPAIFLFARAILEGTPIKLFNHGRMRRDFTYIDDVTRVVTRLVNQLPRDSGPAAGVPAKVYNVGNNHPEELSRLVAVLERELGRPANKETLPMQPGDVTETFADVIELMRDTGFGPHTSIEDWIRDFVAWYRDYDRIRGADESRVVANIGLQ
jgi:UDP-glucuronate 4-epimerase